MKFLFLAYVFLNLQATFSFVFQPTFDVPPSKWNLLKYNEDLSNYTSIVDDPLGSGVKCYKIIYPAKSCANQCSLPGIAGFTGKLNTSSSSFNGTVATFQYDVYFPSNFTFVKVGKLVGIYGTSSNPPKSAKTGAPTCTGILDDISVRNQCFSSRTFWSSNATGYDNLVLPPVSQPKDFCNSNAFDLSTCQQCQNSDIPMSIDCAVGYLFSKQRYFNVGKWNTIKKYIVLNDPGKANGILKIWLNGLLITNYSSIVYRLNSDVIIRGILFQSFFGGQGPNFAPPYDTYSLFKNFKLTDYLY